MRKSIYILAIVSSVLFSCEDQIFPDLPQSQALIGFDAWLYHKAEPQEINVYITNTYFNSDEPVGISGATVTVTNIEDPTDQYIFSEATNGSYIWNPTSPTDTFATMGNAYSLDVNINGVNYQSITELNRVPTIDSITWRFDEGTAFSEDSYFANFWARDFEGAGDTYWIKSWKNGEQLTLPSEINIAYDAAFSEDGNADGLFFIQPIRENINPFDFDDDDVLINPFELGDSIYVEINSVTNDAFFFLEQVQIQTARDGGFGELFAVPLANIQSNVFSEDSNEKVVGFFCISASNGFGTTFTEDLIRIED